MIIVKYETEEEAQQIIAEKTAQGLFLVEMANITEGNFLGFDDSPLKESEYNTIYTNIPAEEIEAIKQSIAELTIILGGK